MARRWVLSIAMIVLALLSFDIPRVFAAMTSTNYQIIWDSVGVGGVDTASSSNYELRSSLGTIQGMAAGSTYQVTEGYRAGVYDQTVDFDVFGQNRSSQVAATALSGVTVTVTSLSDFSIGDYVILIQDEGASQVASIARIVEATSIPPEIIVDAWSGGSPVIDGSNDYLYKLFGSSMDLGTLTSSTIATSVIGWNVTADVSQGYNVYVFEDHDFQTADGDIITDVNDGTVSAGSTEYGGRSSDSSLALSSFDTQDTAFTTTMQQVASRNDNSFGTRDYLTVKGSIASATAGSYSHTLTLIFVGDY